MPEDENGNGNGDDEPEPIRMNVQKSGRCALPAKIKHEAGIKPEQSWKLELVSKAQNGRTWTVKGTRIIE